MAETADAINIDSARAKTPHLMKTMRKWYETADSSQKNEYKKKSSEMCNEFFESEEYKSGDKDYNGYVVCCELMNMCGTSGWVIFLIIVLVLGVLAGGAAAFWFFYGKRKFGGQDDNLEENTDSTENQKSVIEIPIVTY